MNFDDQEYNSPELQHAIDVLTGQEKAPLVKKEVKQANVQRLVPVEESLPAIDPMLSVDLMIEKINCFRLLLQNSLFLGELSEVAESVQDEIRDFIVERIQVLLGQKSPKVDQQFSDPEIQALKHLAGLTLKAKGIKVSSSPILAPTKAPVQVQAAPPQLRLRQVEEPVVKQERAVQQPSLPANPVERVKKKGRPSKAVQAEPKVTKIKSTVGIKDLNTGEMIYPVIEIKEKPKALSGAQPLPMPSLKQVYSQNNQMNAGGQQLIMANGSNVDGNTAQATMDLALAASLRK